MTGDEGAAVTVTKGWCREAITTQPGAEVQLVRAGGDYALDRRSDPVHEKRQIKHRALKFLNNELRTVVGIDEGKIRFDRGEIVRNGALPVDQAIAVTSHTGQGKTVDQIIVSVPVRAHSAKRTKHNATSQCHALVRRFYVFTDSKVALQEAVIRPSKKAFLLGPPGRAEKDRDLKAELERQRAKAQKEQFGENA